MYACVHTYTNGLPGQIKKRPGLVDTPLESLRLFLVLIGQKYAGGGLLLWDIMTLSEKQIRLACELHFLPEISSKRSTVKWCCSLRHQLLPRVKAFLANILPIRFKTFYPDKFWYLNWFSANDSGGISKSEGWWKIKAESLWFNFQCSLSTFYYLPFFLHFPRFFMRVLLFLQHNGFVQYFLFLDYIM